MTCRLVEEEIQKSLDRTLTSLERKRLDAHLASCDVCRHAWAEYRRLSRAAGHWARPTMEDDPGEVFNALVLSRIAARPETLSPPIWLPLIAALSLMGLFASLPGVYGTGGEVIGAAARQTPAWFWNQLHAVSPQAFTAWASSLASIPLPGWTWSILLAMGVVNGAFCVQARRRSVQ